MKNAKVAMMVAVSKAIEYKNHMPDALSSEVLQYVLSNLDAEGEAKIIAIAAADRAIKYKEKNPMASEKEVMQKIMDESAEIMDTIEQYKKHR